MTIMRRISITINVEMITVYGMDKSLRLHGCGEMRRRMMGSGMGGCKTYLEDTVWSMHNVRSIHKRPIESLGDIYVHDLQ